MKILFAGNSQASCIKKAYDDNAATIGTHDVNFYVTPGGTGPYFRVEQGLLSVVKEAINPKFPPRVSSDEVANTPLNCYDVVVVSALGYVDGGFYYANSLTTQGVLFNFSPKKNRYTSRLLSSRCYRQIIYSNLRDQLGFKFLYDLRSNFEGQIIVQPFPVMSEIVRSHKDWPLNQMYEDALGAHGYFMQTCDDFLALTCNEIGADLLPYPRQEWRKNLFAPSHIMATSDGLHPLEPYGKLILRQVADTVS